MSLFLKVFLWFWLAMILVVGTLAGTSYLTRTAREPRAPQFVVGIMWAYSRNAVAAFERDGPAALNSFLDHTERDAGIRAHLFDRGGAELAGREATPDERRLATQADRAGRLVTRRIGGLIYEANPIETRGGDRYVFVAAFPFGPAGPPAEPAGRPPERARPLGPDGPSGLGGPPGPFSFFLGDTPAALFLRVLAVILTAGALCYLLARYIVSPVVKLRAVTRQVAGGDLSARVGPLLGTRRDELADMGRDFDAMATRIEALMEAHQRLLRDISHELRSPLARLGVALDLARKRAGAEAAGHLARIEREARRLNEMIGQLLILSRRETGADGTDRTRVNLSALAREVAEDADFEARGQERSVTIVECEECVMTGTPALLQSAIENVVRNAVRHTPAGTSVKISLRCRQGGADAQALFSVRDEGAGVPEKDLTDIFRPFFRADDSRTRETGGSGLGLAITERAVRLHGGTVTAANVPGGGFTVEIRLPLADEASAESRHN